MVHRPMEVSPMKRCLISLLSLTIASQVMGMSLEEEVFTPETRSGDWLDSGRRIASNTTTNFTRWVDGFFGDVDSDAELADSRLRVRMITDWDETYGTDTRASIGGKVDLPRLADRVDLVFRGDDPDELIPSDEVDPTQSRVGLQVNIDESVGGNHRTDLTLGLARSGPKPGIKYRYQTLLGERTSARFTQRLQYDLDDGGFTTSKLDIDYMLDDQSLIRSYSRVLLGQHTEGAEWSSFLAHVRSWSAENGHERASFIYAGLRGKTEPYRYTNDYEVGVRLRAQAYRDYLFFELEPSYHRRVDMPFAERISTWVVEARVELLLFD